MKRMYMVVLVLFFVVLGSVFYFSLSIKSDIANEPEKQDQTIPETTFNSSEERPAG